MGLRTNRRQLAAWGIASDGIDPKKKFKRGDPPADGNQGRDKLFDAACTAHGLNCPVYQYKFHPTRKWMFDYLFDGWLAVEKVGGVWKNGHHSRGQSQVDDMERRNEAQIMGYVVLEFTPEQFEDGSAFAVIKRALEAREEMS